MLVTSSQAASVAINRLKTHYKNKHDKLPTEDFAYKTILKVIFNYTLRSYSRLFCDLLAAILVRYDIYSSAEIFPDQLTSTLVIYLLFRLLVGLSLIFV